MLAKQGERTGMGTLAGPFVVAFALVAAKSVTRIVVNVARDIRVGFLDLRDLIQRNTAVLVAKIKDDRAFRRRVLGGVNTAAIEGRGRGDALALGRGHP